ncbi:MAG: class I SAM-dependent methyltransferase [Vicinamibacterales bacterium]|nr:class I SAM-dependent methyltransferase [Vicinamibacterales bacterium]
MSTSKSAEEAYREGTDYQFDQHELTLGPWTSYSLVHDPKHMAFVLARYKFVAKMLDGKQNVFEVGSGDGFGLPLVAQHVGRVSCIDWDARLLEGNKRRLAHLTNVDYLLMDLNKEQPKVKADAVYSIDVLEHIEPAQEAQFVENMVRCLTPDGVLITGTPNVTASAHASPRSLVQHINLKSMRSLKELMQGYFENVFMFGQNDEVVHTGYAPMCHYIWAVAAGKKSR